MKKLYFLLIVLLALALSACERPTETPTLTLTPIDTPTVHPTVTGMPTTMPTPTLEPSPTPTVVLTIEPSPTPKESPLLTPTPPESPLVPVEPPAPAARIQRVGLAIAVMMFTALLLSGIGWTLITIIDWRVREVLRR